MPTEKPGGPQTSEDPPRKAEEDSFKNDQQADGLLLETNCLENCAFLDAGPRGQQKRIGDDMAESGRPALIRQRLTEAKLQQEQVATQLKLPPPADEGPATSEARRWALETDFDARSTEIRRVSVLSILIP